MTTIKDIAKMAGVSTATVSRIINGKGEAKQETIDLVMKIVKDLEYHPNKMARSLRQGKSNLISVMIPNLDNPFFGELVGAIEREAAKYGLRISICNTDDSREKVEYFLTNMIDNYAFGAIICTLKVTEDDLASLEEQGIHTVTVDRSHFEHSFSSINIDQLNGAFIATRHLIERGAKKNVLICGPEIERMSGERVKGYQLALQSDELSFSRVAYGDYTLGSGYQIMDTLINEGVQFDGIHASNDLMALGALRRCLDHGLAVPNDVRIVGNDDLTVDKYYNPRLTSLSQMNDRVSHSVINELINLNEKEHTPQKVVMSPELIVRETT